MSDEQLIRCRFFQKDDGVLLELSAKKSPKSAATVSRIFLFPDTATELAKNILEAVDVWKKTHRPPKALQ